MPKTSDAFQRFQIGDSVAYSEAFINRNNRLPSNMAGAHGKVTALHILDKVILADIEWDKPGLPKRVNVKNLVGA